MFNKLLIGHQCGSLSAEVSSYSAFNPVFLGAVGLCSTPSETSALKCQRFREESPLCVFNSAALPLNVASARLRSRWALSLRGLHHSALESRPSCFTSSVDCNSPAFYTESSPPPTVTTACRVESCRDKNCAEELRRDKEMELFVWLSSTQMAFKTVD